MAKTKCPTGKIVKAHTAVVTLRWQDKDYVIRRPSLQEEGESQYIYEFIWRDGNYSCDCNRLMFLDEEHNVLELPEDFDWEHGKDPYPCGDTIQLVDLWFEEGWNDE